MSKTIVITGASTGFGKITAKTLALAGYTVIATMRDVRGKNSNAAEELLSWARTNNLQIEVVELDVASDESVKRAVTLIEGTHPTVDVVINNAGIYGSGITESFAIEDFQKMFDVNVFGSLRVIHGFLPRMRKQQSGLFIQISSIMGRMVVPFASAYTSSKWAVEAIAESLRYELGPLGIDSVIVQPGPFQTEIFQKVTTASRASILADYGATKDYVESFSRSFSTLMAGEIPNKPQDIADAIKKIIETPVGQRPIRVTVDKMLAGLAERINDAQQQVQESFMPNFGLGELLQLKPEAIEA